jgi:hypothetical protein
VCSRENRSISGLTSISRLKELGKIRDMRLISTLLNDGFDFFI